MNQIVNIPFGDYLQIDAVNHSRLKRLAESPWHYQHPPKQKKPSADLIFGTWFHTLLLEPALFPARYVPAPALNKNSDKWKNLVAELAAKGQEPIDPDNWQRLHAMREAVMNDPFVGPLFGNGLSEQTLLFTDPETQLPGKARIDWLPDAYPNVLVDLKTTRSGNPRSLSRSCWDYGYHTQAAFYSMAWREVTNEAPEAFLFVFIEKPDDPDDTPLPPQLYELDPPYREAGEKQVRDWLNVLKQCMDEHGANPWPHYTKGLSTLAAPTWAKLGD